jgi:hypothetical protein
MSGLTKTSCAPARKLPLWESKSDATEVEKELAAVSMGRTMIFSLLFERKKGISRAAQSTGLAW